MQRSDVLILMAMRNLALQTHHPARVGIDVVGAAGKTTLADELAEAMQEVSSRQIHPRFD